MTAATGLPRKGTAAYARAVARITQADAEAHVWDMLAPLEITEQISDAGTVDNMLADGHTLIDVVLATRAQIEPYVCWLDD